MKTRGNKEYTVQPKHYGRIAREYSTLPGQLPRSGGKKKRKKTRSTDTYEEERAKRIKSVAACIPATPPLSDVRRNLRGTKFYCTDFGPDRHESYPGFFFCSKCAMYDVDIILAVNRKQIKRDSKVYECTADHKSFIFPTTKWKPWCYDKQGSSASKTPKEQVVTIQVPVPSPVAAVDNSNIQAHDVATDEETDIQVILSKIETNGHILQRVIEPYLKKAEQQEGDLRKTIGYLQRTNAHLFEEIVSQDDHDKEGGVPAVMEVIREHFGTNCGLVIKNWRAMQMKSCLFFSRRMDLASFVRRHQLYMRSVTYVHVCTHLIVFSDNLTCTLCRIFRQWGCLGS